MNYLEVLRAPWEAKANRLIERWKDCELGIVMVERWQVERSDFYGQIRDEMARSGNDFFLPKALKLLVQIKGPAEQRLEQRWEEGWNYCQRMAEMNEIQSVIKGLDFLDKIYQVLRGPYGYIIRQLDDNSGFVVEVPQAPPEPKGKE